MIERVFSNLLNFFERNNDSSNDEKIISILKKIINHYAKNESFEQVFNGVKYLAGIFLKKKDYSNFESILLENVTWFKKARDEIKIYLLLANSFFRVEKYEEARNYYQDILDKLKRFKKDKTLALKIYIRLINIAQKLNETPEKIKKAYQKAKHFLDGHQNSIENAQEYIDKLEKIWLEIEGYTINNHIAANRELKQDIANIKNTIEPLTKQYQIIDEKINRFEWKMQQEITVFNSRFEEIKKLIQENLKKPLEPSKNFFQKIIDSVIARFMTKK
ncbi:tetratricopeptide repeat protein [Thioflexithrix psekupsensis]|uniref:tetratricopeptide repeat protein n=1 Tax=Thioflexithrix psekupsensis TaxID=1570016 RepID=UPI00111E67CE|nr:hypothetical protein [Thioflexithrix psekupsensis]